MHPPYEADSNTAWTLAIQAFQPVRRAEDQRVLDRLRVVAARTPPDVKPAPRYRRCAATFDRRTSSVRLAAPRLVAGLEMAAANRRMPEALPRSSGRTARLLMCILIDDLPERAEAGHRRIVRIT